MPSQTIKRLKQKSRGRPPKGGLGFDETREALIRCGIELLTEQGFSSTGIDQILKQVNVPKGSFYHYFQNKEAFGIVLIENYSQYFVHKLEKHLLNENLDPLARLEVFMQDAMSGMSRYDFKRGCLIGNLTQEFGCSHEVFQEKLKSAFKQWINRVADCLELAKSQNQIAQDNDSQQLAEFFWIGWEGAVMHSKLSQNKQPMELFSGQFFKLLNQNTPT